ncbi:MAG: hypothetical protein JXQ75_23735, partial [Phycisphaerae bacterium]|nr:hypothetical protein [Phycisphaerae bacterium]
GKTVAPAPKPVVFTVRNGVSEPLFSLLPRAAGIELPPEVSRSPDSHYIRACREGPGDWA